MKICDREGLMQMPKGICPEGIMLKEHYKRKLAIARQNMKCFGAKSGLKKGLGYGSERGYN